MMTDEDCEIEIASRIYIAGLPPSRRRKECSDTLIRLRAVQKGKLPPYDKDEYMNRYLFIRGYVDNQDVRRGFAICDKGTEITVQETFVPMMRDTIPLKRDNIF